MSSKSDFAFYLYFVVYISCECYKKVKSTFQICFALLPLLVSKCAVILNYAQSGGVAYRTGNLISLKSNAKKCGRCFYEHPTKNRIVSAVQTRL
jgi:hypothetical protein